MVALIGVGCSNAPAETGSGIGAPAPFRLDTHMIHSSFITFMASIVVSIVLALRGKAMSWPERSCLGWPSTFRSSWV